MPIVIIIGNFFRLIFNFFPWVCNGRRTQISDYEELVSKTNARVACVMPSSGCLARATKDLYDSRHFCHYCFCPEGVLESTKFLSEQYRDKIVYITISIKINLN